MTNVGTRPTESDSDRVSVETYLLGFEGDLYGQELRVEFCRRLRGEQRFDTLEAAAAGDTAEYSAGRSLF